MLTHEQLLAAIDRQVSPQLYAYAVKCGGVQVNSKIHFPNGFGYTPCTQEYKALHDKQDNLRAKYATLESMTPEDYQLWNVQENALLTMQAHGHLGKSVVF